MKNVLCFPVILHGINKTHVFIYILGKWHTVVFSLLTLFFTFIFTKFTLIGRFCPAFFYYHVFSAIDKILLWYVNSFHAKQADEDWILMQYNTSNLDAKLIGKGRNASLGVQALYMNNSHKNPFKNSHFDVLFLSKIPSSLTRNASV